MLGKFLADIWRSPAAAQPREGANPLAAYFFANPGRMIQKWHHYFDIYHRHFQAFRGQSPVVLEIGVFQGGSLQMWREYFGPGAQIVGIDVDQRCKQFEEEQISVMIGNQADRAFLADVRRQLPRIDIVIDDGGHRMDQQIASFEELYPHLQPNGVYLCEDNHTSYFQRYGGGHRRPGTFIEYSKGLIDRLHAWHSEEPETFGVDELTRNTYALHFYDSILVAEKRPISPPQQSASGIQSF